MNTVQSCDICSDFDYASYEIFQIIWKVFAMGQTMATKNIPIQI